MCPHPYTKSAIKWNCHDILFSYIGTIHLYHPKLFLSCGFRIQCHLWYWIISHLVWLPTTFIIWLRCQNTLSYGYQLPLNGNKADIWAVSSMTSARILLCGFRPWCDGNVCSDYTNVCHYILLSDLFFATILRFELIGLNHWHAKKILLVLLDVLWCVLFDKHLLYLVE